MTPWISYQSQKINLFGEVVRFSGLFTLEKCAAGGQHELVGGDRGVVGRDEGQVVKQAGGPEVPEGGAPAAGVGVPLEPEHLARQHLRHDGDTGTAISENIHRFCLEKNRVDLRER